MIKLKENIAKFREDRSKVAEWVLIVDAGSVGVPECNWW